jgi:hypothetical protein
MFEWFTRKPDITAGIMTGLAEIRALDPLTRVQVQKGVVLAHRHVRERFPESNDWMFSKWEDKSAMFDQLGELEKTWKARDVAVSRGIWLVTASLAALPMKPPTSTEISKLMDELLLNRIEVLGAVTSAVDQDDT